MRTRANDPLSHWSPHPHCIVTVTRSCWVTTDNFGLFNRELDQWISFESRGIIVKIADSSDLYYLACHDCPLFSKQEFNLRAKYWHYYSVVTGPKNFTGWCTKSCCWQAWSSMEHLSVLWGSHELCVVRTWCCCHGHNCELTEVNITQVLLSHPTCLDNITTTAQQQFGSIFVILMWNAI